MIVHAFTRLSAAARRSREVGGDRANANSGTRQASWIVLTNAFPIRSPAHFPLLNVINHQTLSPFPSYQPIPRSLFFSNHTPFRLIPNQPTDDLRCPPCAPLSQFFRTTVACHFHIQKATCDQLPRALDPSIFEPISQTRSVSPARPNKTLSRRPSRSAKIGALPFRLDIIDGLVLKHLPLIAVHSSSGPWHPGLRGRITTLVIAT